MTDAFSFWAFVGAFLSAFVILFGTYWMWLPVVAALLLVKPVWLKVHSFLRGGVK